MQYDIVVLGDYFFDQIFSELPRFPVLGCETYAQELVSTGGAMYITATAFHRLGVRVGWPAYFGDDYYSQYVYSLVQKGGLDLSLACVVDRPYRRVTTSIPYQGERAFVTFADPAPDDRAEHRLSSLDRCEFSHLHLGGWTSVPDLQPYAEKARSKGATVSMDCQDVQCLLEPPTCLAPLDLVDIFMPNAREAKIITETDDIRSAIERLMPLVEYVVVKDGANGAWVGHKGEILQGPAVSVGPVIDTTGAGDCFNAGFLFGLKVQNAPLAQCLQYGNLCGGFSVTGIGGATTAPTYGQLTEWLEKHDS